MAEDRLEGLFYNVAIKAPCVAATTANIALNGLQAIDGVTVAAGNRVLVWQQSNPVLNGIYVADTGDWSRDVDFANTGDCVLGTIVLVTNGTQYGSTILQQTTVNPVIGSTALTFAVTGAAALALASVYMRGSIFPLTTPAAVRAELAAAGVADNNAFAGDNTHTGIEDFTNGRIKVPTRQAGDNGTDGASTAFVKVKAEVVVGGTALRSYLAGLTLSNNGGTPNTKLDVAAGVCADATNAQMLVVLAGTIDCTTTGANGLDAGSLAVSTSYYVWVLGKTDGTTALLVSTSGAPTMPAGYTLKRRIGGFKTDGSSHIRTFIQDGDLFQWLAPNTNPISATNPGTSAVTRAADVPTGASVRAVLQIVQNNGGAQSAAVLISDLATTDTAPALGTLNDTSSSTIGATVKNVRTNASGQYRSRLSFSDGSTILTINTLGWIDRRGRDG